jgi:hypothetical protein
MILLLFLQKQNLMVCARLSCARAQPKAPRCNIRLHQAQWAPSLQGCVSRKNTESLASTAKYIPAQYTLKSSELNDVLKPSVKTVLNIRAEHPSQRKRECGLFRRRAEATKGYPRAWFGLQETDIYHLSNVTVESSQVRIECFFDGLENVSRDADP